MGSVTMVLSSIYGGLRGPDIFHSGPHIHIKYSHCVVGLRQSNRCSQWDSTFITRPVTWRLHQPGKLNVKCVTKGSPPRLIWERMHTNSITRMMWVTPQSDSNCLYWDSPPQRAQTKLKQSESSFLQHPLWMFYFSNFFFLYLYFLFPKINPRDWKI